MTMMMMIVYLCVNYWFSIECCKAKTKPFTYQLDDSANIKNQNQRIFLIEEPAWPSGGALYL